MSIYVTNASIFADSHYNKTFILENSDSWIRLIWLCFCIYTKFFPNFLRFQAVRFYLSPSDSSKKRSKNTAEHGDFWEEVNSVEAFENLSNRLEISLICRSYGEAAALYKVLHFYFLGIDFGVIYFSWWLNYLLFLFFLKA